MTPRHRRARLLAVAACAALCAARTIPGESASPASSPSSPAPPPERGGLAPALAAALLDEVRPSPEASLLHTLGVDAASLAHALEGPRGWAASVASSLLWPAVLADDDSVKPALAALVGVHLPADQVLTRFARGLLGTLTGRELALLRLTTVGVAEIDEDGGVAGLATTLAVQLADRDSALTFAVLRAVFSLTMRASPDSQHRQPQWSGGNNAQVVEGGHWATLLQRIIAQLPKAALDAASSAHVASSAAGDDARGGSGSGGDSAGHNTRRKRRARQVDRAEAAPPAPDRMAFGAAGVFDGSSGSTGARSGTQPLRQALAQAVMGSMTSPRTTLLHAMGWDVAAVAAALGPPDHVNGVAAAVYDVIWSEVVENPATIHRLLDTLPAGLFSHDGAGGDAAPLASAFVEALEAELSPREVTVLRALGLVDKRGGGGAGAVRLLSADELAYPRGWLGRDLATTLLGPLLKPTPEGLQRVLHRMAETPAGGGDAAAAATPAASRAAMAAALLGELPQRHAAMLRAAGLNVTTLAAELANTRSALGRSAAAGALILGLYNSPILSDDRYGLSGMLADMRLGHAAATGGL